MKLDRIKYKKIDVTVGAGFLGSHLCERLIRIGAGVTCVDNFLTGHPSNVASLVGHSRFEFIRHDVTKDLYINSPVFAVLHFASPASPVDYLKLPIQTLKVGALGTHKMLGLAKEKKARFLLASTSEVYGDPKIHPQPESYWGNVNPVGPRGVYDEAKRYAEALTYMAQGNYPSANEVVEDIPEEHDLKAPEMVERQRMLDLIAFLQGVQLDGRTEAELDSTEVDALEALVADAHDRPAVWAQNLLCYAYDRCRSWPTGGDGMDWRALSAGQNEQPTFEPSGLRINPNPAETWVALNNKLPKAAPTGELRLLDVTGRLLWSRKLADTYGQVVVDTRTWSTGSYTVELRQGERTLATERLLVKN